MLRKLICCAILACAAHAATVRLYLKDGNYHSVREYEKLGDRVRFYSTERADWEEIPLELVDLKRTEQEVASAEAARKEEAAVIDAEEKADRAQKREIERVPVNPGVYQVSGETVTEIKQGEVKVVNNRRRSILKAITPIPILTGQSTVELDGLKSLTVLPTGRPEFYMRLAEPERFAIVRLKALKTTRLVQKWDKIPVSNELMETTDIVETFKQQLADGLYKIWPTKPLEPGEYAVIEYTEGKGNLQAWDFGVAAAR